MTRRFATWSVDVGGGWVGQMRYTYRRAIPDYSPSPTVWVCHDDADSDDPG